MRNKKWLHTAAAAAGILTVFVTSFPVSAAGSAPVATALPGAGAELYFSPQTVSLSELRSAYAAEDTAAVHAGAAMATLFEGGPKITVAAGLSAATSASMEDVREAADKRDEEAPVQAQGPAETVVATFPVTVDFTISGASNLIPLTGSGTLQETVETPVQQGADELASAQSQDVVVWDLPDSGTVIADVDDFVNVREAPDTEAPIVGKFYSGAVGEILGATDDGWFMISSGTVTGFVKAEFCATGSDAMEMLAFSERRYATVNTMSLNLRAEDNTSSNVLEILEIGDRFPVLEEYDEWVRVESFEGEEGYLFREYVDLSTEYLTAESREEEEARLEREREREEARLAEIAAASQRNAGATGVTQNYTPAANYATSYSDTGAAVAAFALQFVGNPYVWGGSSLTNGTDCSGFTMAVYANFGISLPHGTYWQMDYGTPVESLATAAPGDVVIYRGHAGIYIGNGQIVHASHPGVGIIVSSAYYDTPIGIRRFFF